jgi:hypothetical protein
MHTCHAHLPCTVTAKSLPLLSLQDEDASVIVKTTDTCPCIYSGNYYSNKRWCCGDMVRAVGD